MYIFVGLEYDGKPFTFNPFNFKVDTFDLDIEKFKLIYMHRGTCTTPVITTAGGMYYQELRSLIGSLQAIIDFGLNSIDYYDFFDPDIVKNITLLNTLITRLNKYCELNFPDYLILDMFDREDVLNEHKRQIH